MSRLREWVETKLDVISVSGDEVIAACPWCGKDKLWINIAKRKFLCYRGCARGSAINLVRHVDGATKIHARESIQERFDGDLEDDLIGLREDDVREDLVSIPLPEDYRPCFDGDLWRVPKYASEAPPHGRGLSDDDLVRHGIGYVGNVYTRWRKRLIIPVAFAGNQTFVARLCGPPSKFAWTSKEGERVLPKRYLYPKGSQTGRLLYWGDHIPEGVDLIIVEGIFDVIRLVGLGFHAVATFGKKISVEQRLAIVRLKPKSVTVIYDSDARGDAVRAALSLADRVESFYATIPEDPDVYGYEYGAEGINDILFQRLKPASDLDALAFDLESL